MGLVSDGFTMEELKVKKQVRFSKFSFNLPKVKVSKSKSKIASFFRQSRSRVWSRYLLLRRSKIRIILKQKPEKRKAEELDEEDKWSRKRIRLTETKPVELKLYDMYKPKITPLPLQPKLTRAQYHSFTRSLSSPGFLRQKRDSYFSSPSLNSLTNPRNPAFRMSSGHSTFSNPNLSTFSRAKMATANLSRAFSSPAISRRPSSIQKYKQNSIRPRLALVAAVPPKIEDILCKKYPKTSKRMMSSKKEHKEPTVITKSKSEPALGTNSSPAPALPPRLPRMRYL